MTNWYENLTTPIINIPSKTKLEAPFGFAETTTSKKSNSLSPLSQTKPERKSNIDDLKISKAWEIATSPGKQLPTTMFMSYMSGNSLQIIPITMTVSLFTGVFNAISGVNKTFHGLETPKNKDHIYLARIVFILLQLLTLAFGIWKLNNMGLIPNKRGDWLAWENPASSVERVL